MLFWWYERSIKHYQVEEVNTRNWPRDQETDSEGRSDRGVGASADRNLRCAGLM